MYPKRKLSFEIDTSVPRRRAELFLQLQDIPLPVSRRSWPPASTMSVRGKVKKSVNTQDDIVTPGQEDKVTAAVESITDPKPPPPEPLDSIRKRRWIVLSFWLLAAFVGLPIWWKTTTVYRASLPIPSMMEWSEGKACQPVFPLRIQLEAPSMPRTDAEHLLQLTQHTLDDENDFSAHHLRLTYAGTGRNDTGKPSTKHDPSSTSEPPVLTVKLKPSREVTTLTSSLDPHSPILNIEYTPNMIYSASTTSSELGSYIARTLSSIFSEERDILSHLLINSATTAQHASSQQHRNLNPKKVAALDRRSTRAMKYAPIYHLTFSLITPGASPSAWEISAALSETIEPLLASLTSISNFTIDTQVQPYSVLSDSVQPFYSGPEAAFLLKREELGSFINAAEWPLSPSIGTGPTINFVLFIPSRPHFPLYVADSSSDSWLVPQWGGVVILNPVSHPVLQPDETTLTKATLQPAVLTFSHQLLSLLGLPSAHLQPESGAEADPNSTPLPLPLRLSTLKRFLATQLLSTASSTLGSIARLTNGLPSISVPGTVASSVSLTMSHLDASCSALKSGDFDSALDNARIAQGESEKAFFEPSMVGQVYFPDEHKVAVYLPLLGPVAVPLIIGAIRELKPFIQALKNRRKPKAE